MFYRINASEHVNLSHVRKVTYDGKFTRLYYSDAPHDCTRLEGDYVDAITKAITPKAK